MAFTVFFFVIVFQALVAAVVIFFLRQLLDKELVEAALEKLQGWPAGTGTGDIAVRLGREDPQVQARFKESALRRFPHARFTIGQDAGLKGGAVIAVGDETVDFSVAHRLRNFWS